jgi:hypothetical protein
MEDLIELVAASFARHGIAGPGDSQFVEAEHSRAVAHDGTSESPIAQVALTTALPEHNYRKSLQGDPAP